MGDVFLNVSDKDETMKPIGERMKGAITELRIQKRDINNFEEKDEDVTIVEILGILRRNFEFAKIPYSIVKDMAEANKEVTNIDEKVMAIEVDTTLSHIIKNIIEVYRMPDNTYKILCMHHGNIVNM